MSHDHPNHEHNQEGQVQLVTFKVGDIVLGIDIEHVQEINRLLDVTRVPGASRMIHGVVNLRGEVVTVLDPHTIFDVRSSGTSDSRRNLVLRAGGERIGVMVDQVADILTIQRSELSPRPSNVRSVDRRFIDSVYLSDAGVIIILCADSLINAIDQSPELALAGA